MFGQKYAEYIGEFWDHDVINYPAHHFPDQSWSDRSDTTTNNTTNTTTFCRHLPMQCSATVPPSSKDRRCLRRAACGHHQVPLREGGTYIHQWNDRGLVAESRIRFFQTRCMSTLTTSRTCWSPCLALLSPLSSSWYDIKPSWFWYKESNPNIWMGGLSFLHNNLVEVEPRAFTPRRLGISLVKPVVYIPCKAFIQATRALGSLGPQRP